jgi:hypothetical protein
MNENSSEIDRGLGPQKVILPQQAVGRNSRDASQRSRIKTVAVAREVANRRQARDRLLVRVDSKAVGGVDESVSASVDWVSVRADLALVRGDCVFMPVDLVLVGVDWVFVRAYCVFVRVDLVLLRVDCTFVRGALVFVRVDCVLVHVDCVFVHGALVFVPVVCVRGLLDLVLVREVCVYVLEDCLFVRVDLVLVRVDCVFVCVNSVFLRALIAIRRRHPEVDHVDRVAELAAANKEVLRLNVAVQEAA